LGGSTLSYVRETSELDPRTRKLTLKTQNLSMSNVLKINETVTYTVHPEESHSTLFTQEAQFVAGSALSRFSSYVEDFCLTRFRDNAAVGRAGFESVLEKFKAARLEAASQLEKLEKATHATAASTASL
ncbi:MAG: PRELI-like family-domain-containing protein, partial [Benniella sp.]